MENYRIIKLKDYRFMEIRKLSDAHCAVATEYARQFGKILGTDPEYWVGDDPEICCFGDCWFFTLDEMRAVVDGIDKYVTRYGSREAVGQEIRDWEEWWLEDMHIGDVMEVVMPRATKQLRPNISLQAWLDGCPRDERKAWTGPDADLMRMENDVATLERLIVEFRANRTLENVLANLRAKLDVAKEEKARRDFEEWEKMMKGQRLMKGRRMSDGV